MLLHHIDHSLEALKPMAEDKELRDDKLSPEDVQLWISGNLSMAENIAKRIALDATSKRVWSGGGPFWMKARISITWQEARNELRVLRQCIEADLEDKWFAFIVPEKAALLQSAKNDWRIVLGSIPEAKRDIQDALYCYALERDTASVFHLMRVAEFGLRILAKKLRVSLDLKHKGTIIPIDHAEWQKVIDAIKNKLGKIKNLPAGPKRAAQLELLSDAGDHCLFMKDIWRNAVSHTRKPYNPTEALGALTRVRDFMVFIARDIVKNRKEPGIQKLRSNDAPTNQGAAQSNQGGTGYGARSEEEEAEAAERAREDFWGPR